MTRLSVIRLTPPGRGAIATLRLQGPGASSALARLLPAALPEGRLAVRRLGGELGETVVLRRLDDQTWEIHCHGGAAAIAAIESALVGLGAEPSPWTEWVARQWPTTAAEAAIALAHARTQRGALILLDQWHGALDRALAEVGRLSADGQFDSARAEIETLLARADVGLHLTHPWHVVLAGPANAGKSSLLNALLGFNRAIVDPQPGTTRDLVSGAAAIDGWPVELRDTAGLRPSADPVEQAGIQRAWEAIAAADLVLLVSDASGPWLGQAVLQARPDAMVVYTKADLPPNPAPGPPGVATSALTGSGLGALCEQIARRLVPHPPAAGAAVPFTSRQVAALRAVRQLAALRGEGF